MKKWMSITLLLVMLLCGGWVVELMWSAGQFKAIEIFLLQDDLLVHQKTVAAPALVSPNDLVAVGPDRFYVTNDHRYPGGFKRLVEEYTRRSWSNVLFYNGSEFVEAASGLGYANGINVSANGRISFTLPGPSLGGPIRQRLSGGRNLFG